MSSTKIVLDLENIEVKFKDEDLALLVLTSLPASYEYFVDILLCGREALTLEDVMATPNSKEIKERSKAKGDDGEGLYVRGRTDRKDSRQLRGKSRPKSRCGRLKCYICQSEGHLKRNCPKNNRKKSTVYVKKDEQPSSSGSTYDDSEVVMLGDNMECKIRGIGKVRVQVKMGQVLCYTMSVGQNQVAGELNASVEEKDSLTQVWHKRLGHVGKTGLQVLEKQGLFGKKSLVENQTGRTVKKMRTDNGLEFCNREFEQLCIESRIARHLTVAGTPGRRNRMSGLPKTFWAEATCTAAYLINRSPSTTIKKKTLMEMWSGHPSDYGVLRIFGCVAYSHVKQGKLELRAIHCVLLGNPEGVKGYRLYRLDGESPKILTSRNVVFNKSVVRY
ncbi:retrovirus-related pol polyprotein from transposon TNT 1-94 [Tanacetum coccineum]